MADLVKSAGMVRAVVLDMDGLMFDTEALYFECGEELLRRRGRSFSVSLSQRIMGLPGLRAMEVIAAEHGLSETPGELFGETQELFHTLLKTSLRLMPGLLEFLARAEARGLPLAVATSTVRITTELMLGQFDLARRFKFVLTREDVTCGKPDPEIYQLACRRLNLSPNAVLVLEDSLNGIQSAKSAGCRCVAIPHELNRSLDFAAADLVVAHLLDERLLRYCGFE